MTQVAILLTCQLSAEETITIKASLALTLKGPQSIQTSGIDVTWGRAALIDI